MKKIITAICIAILLAGCNRQVIDMTYSFDKAIISIDGQVIAEGKVESWRDYDNSDQIQVTIDGVTYLTHITNVVLINE